MTDVRDDHKLMWSRENSLAKWGNCWTTRETIPTVRIPYHFARLLSRLAKEIVRKRGTAGVGGPAACMDAGEEFDMDVVPRGFCCTPRDDLTLTSGRSRQAGNLCQGGCSCLAPFQESGR